jgi:hypothetical protein
MGLATDKKVQPFLDHDAMHRVDLMHNDVFFRCMPTTTNMLCETANTLKAFW